MHLIYDIFAKYHEHAATRNDETLEGLLPSLHAKSFLHMV